jgi:peptidoglycan/xylan/chitin deacetylase (PgdA/CDA1 family)
MRLRRSAKDALYIAARLAGPRVHSVRAILMYHDVGGAGGPDVRLFEQQMEVITARSRVVPLSALPEALSGGGSVTVVTIDDGYATAVQAVLPVLARCSVQATFFLPSGLLGQTFQTSGGPRRLIDLEGVRSLLAAGHEIGGHTLSHPKLTTVPSSEARGEIERDRDALSTLAGESVSSFAYPKGDHDDAVRTMVRDAGYRLAVTVREDLLHGPLDPWTLPRVAVNGTMGMSQFAAKLSGGLHVYERLRGRR